VAIHESGASRIVFEWQVQPMAPPVLHLIPALLRLYTVYICRITPYVPHFSISGRDKENRVMHTVHTLTLLLLDNHHHQSHPLLFVSTVNTVSLMSLIITYESRQRPGIDQAHTPIRSHGSTDKTAIPHSHRSQPSFALIPSNWIWNT